MRASPALRCVLSRFGVWRAAIAALAGAGVAVLLVWLLARSEPPPLLGLVAWVVATLAVPALAASLMRMPPITLRWDGQQWWVEANAGEIDVALDLGGWMLLRFRPISAAGHKRSPQWLPVQRQGLEAHWHALRCAVYSPRPAPAREAADQP